ncbi:unnamed protein product [Polarella glacialis]|uniref:Uncharacterized protein n=1 Tax=Polarella glacialis TaxID=89957 RepID=A0A813GKC2_POLGL|nr:unnamed protein product [Polarella glacialis]
MKFADSTNNSADERDAMKSAGSTGPDSTNNSADERDAMKSAGSTGPDSTNNSADERDAMKSAGSTSPDSTNNSAVERDAMNSAGSTGPDSTDNSADERDAMKSAGSTGPDSTNNSADERNAMKSAGSTGPDSTNNSADERDAMKSAGSTGPDSTNNSAVERDAMKSAGSTGPDSTNNSAVERDAMKSAGSTGTAPASTLWPAPASKLWSQVGVGLGSLALISIGYMQYEQARLANEQARLANEQARVATPQYKVQHAAEQMLQPFDPIVRWAVSPPLPRPRIIQNLKEITDVPGVTVVSGQAGAGKSVAVEQALLGRRGVLRVHVEGDAWEAKMLAALGITQDQLAPMLRKVMQDLQDQIPGPCPIIILDVPRDSLITSMRTLNNFCKELAINIPLCHVIVLVSSMKHAMGIDVGGRERSSIVVVSNFTLEEATDFVCRLLAASAWGDGSTRADAASVLTERIGTNPLALAHACHLMASKSMEPHVVVDRLRWWAMKDMKDLRYFSLTHPIGKWLIDALLASDGGVSQMDSKWCKLGITARDLATGLHNCRMRGATYNPETDTWHFASPAHLWAAQQTAAQSSGCTE